MAEGAQIITSLCPLGMVVLALLSMVPVDLRRGWQTVALYYPVVGLGLFALYEAGIQAQIPPENVPIRIDLAFVYPLVGFIVLMGICRWMICLRAQGEREGATSGNIELRTPKEGQRGDGGAVGGGDCQLGGFKGRRRYEFHEFSEERARLGHSKVREVK